LKSECAIDEPVSPAEIAIFDVDVDGELHAKSGALGPGDLCTYMKRPPITRIIARPTEGILFDLF
jgi:hypothetical protein